ncbi:MAG: hypothetical protein WBP94_08835 [Rhodomicrobiaceae bacterium]
MGRVAPYPGGEPGGKRPVLDLSGPKLRAAFETLVKASEPIGGIEAFAEALKLKSQLLQERLADGRLAALDRMAFENMCVLMATARRRIGRLLDAEGWPRVRAGIADLIADADMPGTADARLLRFRKSFGEGRERRFVRDLAAEILHNLYPEHYPLMTRWVWDAKANTGALREIWHGEDVDRMVIPVSDTHETFLVLREELSQFLADNGVFRDVLWYIDLLLGQVYADYINAQGGAYLKTDFASESDPLEHTRRILGVDARIARNNGKTIDGTAERVDAIRKLN